MKTKIKITFGNGETAVVAFSHGRKADIEIVIRAWAMLWRRTVMKLERSTEPASHWYDGRRKRMNRYDDEICHDMLTLLLPLAKFCSTQSVDNDPLKASGRKVWG